ADRLRGRSPGYDKPGQPQLAGGGPAALAAQQQPSAVGHRDDNRRVGARVMVRSASLATALPAATGERDRTAARTAMAVTLTPVLQRARLREDPGFEGRPARGGGAQVQPTGAAGRGQFRIQREPAGTGRATSEEDRRARAARALAQLASGRGKERTFVAH